MIFFTIGYIFGAILNYRLKSKLINRGLTDIDLLKALSQVSVDSKFKSLKWALVLAFAGAGLLVLECFSFTLNSTAPYGIIALFIAAGLFTYYMITGRNKSSQEAD
ncbi:DUF6249 domain-containing protein [Mucilaginibacter sp. CAU 1740]|uniref:DUF6249 domain-containing protein n=1 Tax=Mucilaginibacter sp. CAU 1740 TaxID=3140365 RepID=UPI00325B39F8